MDKFFLICQIVGICLLIIGLGLKIYLKGIKDANKTTPEQDLQDLDWKLNACQTNRPSGITIQNQIKKMQRRPDIDKVKLRRIELKWRQKFSGVVDAADPDEHSIEHSDFEGLLHSNNIQKIIDND
jgi:hypothetical protein